MGQAESLLAGGLAEIREGLDRGDATSSEIVEASLARIEKTAALTVVVSTRAESALAEAESASKRIAAGQALSPLDGIPVLLKDNIVHAGEPATCSNGYFPSPPNPPEHDPEYTCCPSATSYRSGSCGDHAWGAYRDGYSKCASVGREPYPEGDAALHAMGDDAETCCFCDHDEGDGCGARQILRYLAILYDLPTDKNTLLLDLV